MRYFLSFCCVLICVLSWSQFLPGNKNGRFSILSPNGSQLLPQSYHDLGNFDSKGLTYFAEFDRYGILNSKGEVVHPANYKYVLQMGGGLYQCQTEIGMCLIDFSLKDRTIINMDDAELVQPSWYKIGYRDSSFLVNIHSKIQIPFAKNKHPFLHVDHVWMPPTQEDSLGQLFDGRGEQVLLDVQRPFRFQYALFIKNSRESKLVFSDATILFPVDVDAVKMNSRNIQYSSRGVTYIMDLETKAIVFSAPYDDLFELEHYWITEKNNKQGVISKTGELILPPKYTQVSQYREFFFVHGDGGQGVTDSVGRMILPCAFDYVYPDAEFFYVYTSEFSGLYSRKKNAMLFPCIYDNITVKEGEIRARSGDLMKVCKLDDQHAIVSELVLQDMIVMKRRQKLGDFDARLLSQGWFFEEESLFDREGFAMGSKRNWGLLSDTGSVLIQPKFAEPTYIPSAEVNLLPKGEIEMKYGGLRDFRLNGYSLVSNKTGRPVINDIVVSMDTTDGLNRGYVRYISNKSFGIILGDNSTRKYNFMESTDDRYIRVCNFESVKVVEDKRKEVSWPNIDLNSDPPRFIDYILSSTEDLSAIELVEAKWNFLSPDGTELLKEPLSFVEPFYREISIVEKEGNWGVMNVDSMVIPAKYKRIRRFSEVSDTLLLLSFVPQGQRYLDSLGHPFGIEVHRFGGANDALLNLEIAKEKWLINEMYTPVAKGDKSFRFLEDGYFFAKNRKMFELYSPDGTLLSETEIEPEEIICDRFVVFKKGSRSGLANFNGEIVQDPVCSEVKQLGSMIYIDLGDSKHLYSEKFEQVKKIKSGTFLVDEVNGNWATEKKGKVVVYSAETGKKIRAFSNDNPAFIHNNWIIFKGKSACVESYTSELRIELGMDVDEVEFHPFGCIVSAKEGGVYLFDLEWKPIAQELEIRRAKQLGEGILLLRALQGQFIVNDTLIKQIGTSARVSGTYSDGLILVNENGADHFMNANGENPFKRKFKQAHSFKNGFASVALAQGWTIIDAKGRAQTLPTFEKISPLGARVFTTGKQELFGLFDRNGKEILPIEFQKLTKVSEGILQGIKQGEIFYFDYSGKALQFN